MHKFRAGANESGLEEQCPIHKEYTILFSELSIFL